MSVESLIEHLKSSLGIDIAVTRERILDEFNAATNMGQKLKGLFRK